MKLQKLTVIIYTQINRKNCELWLKKEVMKEPYNDSEIDVKSIEECRGLEFPVLVTITDEADNTGGGIEYASVIDTWTRVTSSLFVIHMEGRMDNRLSTALKASLKYKAAKELEET